MSPEQLRKIAEALIIMMRDKGSNVIARGAGGRPTAIVDDAGKQIDEIPPAPQMATQLRESRQQAQDVQGPDPLAQTASDWQQDTAGMVPPGSPPITRTGNLGDPSRLPADPVKFDQPAPSMSRDLDTFPDRETYYGRPPDEIDPADLKRARQEALDAGELQPGDVLGTAEEMEEVGKQIFRKLFPIVAKGEMPDAKLLAQLEDTHPPLADYLKEEMKDQGLLITSRDNPIIDDIPF